jgi:uncharacterized repeat protein (TIGR03847 family)
VASPGCEHRVVDLEPVDRITADAVGEPGQRTFYLQARKDLDLVTILVEKQQVELLSSSILEILARVGKETAQGPPEEEMDLEEPIDPAWRAGRLSIGYLEDRDLLLLEVEEALEEDEEREADRVRLWATPEQMLSLSRHGALVCARGRPKCQFCGNPLDPEGHACPAMNGHGSPGV